MRKNESRGAVEEAVNKLIGDITPRWKKQYKGRSKS
jgi:hypothetical protein